MKLSRHAWLRVFSLALIASILVAACTSNVPLPEQKTIQGDAGLTAMDYLRAEAQGKNILRVDSAASLVVFEVRRDGPFARLGHDHVVASHEVTGFVAPDRNTADLQVPMATLAVDEAPLRAAAGFDTQPTSDDIAGTRRNMLLHVLEAARYPTARIHIERKQGDDDAAMLQVAITLHGTTRTFDVPAQIRRTADGMIVSGSMHFNQTDFGMVPYSILNGAIKVRDRLDMRFRIFAKRRG